MRALRRQITTTEVLLTLLVGASACGGCGDKPAPEPSTGTGSASGGGGGGLPAGKPIDVAVDRIGPERAACDRGDGDACVRVAGDSHDANERVALFEKGCAAQSGQACGNLGATYRNGRGVPVDLAKAYAALTRACAVTKYDPRDAAALASTCNDVAGMARLGNGVPKDLPAAFHAYELACAHGDVFCTNLAIAQQEGIGTDKDPAKARATYAKACTAGSGDACNNLGDLTKRGVGGAADPAAAKPLFDKACKAGVQVGCKNFADTK